MKRLKNNNWVEPFDHRSRPLPQRPRRNRVVVVAADIAADADVAVAVADVAVADVVAADVVADADVVAVADVDDLRYN